jgi:predicted transglutaminase-like cysteine proteinase
MRTTIMNSPKRILLATALAYAASMTAHADCVLPPAPSKIPDGSTASEQEMITAMQTLKEYNGDVDTYTKCLEFEAKQNHLTRTDEEKMHNSAVETLQKVASKFNEQVRTFKAKSG